ncbi:heavy metal translocating P-type ATPase [Pusillimonas sp. ANT_WB101]|uniref:heavy metal translocating P-type ATPase n=1 Tax=Pusillimonas sp. ANT_WB101 TaxID=2597356 RepID=UPI0011EBB7E4|nr:heavy metal translocating P-type ATPase [Pusillimonas sp. ANT_WB101]KAA0910855.1 heavy metal translocating P-type ATPase [Pusillimonas sp. ANT_WB101]
MSQILKKPKYNDTVLLALSVLALVSGAILHWSGNPAFADWCWIASAVLVAALLLIESAIRLWHREVRVDLIALLAIIGALLLDQSLVAAVIAVMLTGGQALEAYALRRAQKEISKLIERAPIYAWRHKNNNDGLEQIPIATVVVGDRLLVRSGELVPVDGDVLDPVAILDESSLTGESQPAKHVLGSRIQSGSVNASMPFDMRAARPAAQSTYSGIVRQVEEAQRSHAPLTRMTDRFALLFIPLTVGIAGMAWLLSGEAVRALAVLVVATPCPLILAAPVAIVGGLSRCAKRGILVKGGAVLEALAGARMLFFDKTGTLTTGKMLLLAIETGGHMEENELVRVVASLAQASTHVASQNIVRIAQERGLVLSTPCDVLEDAGAGLSGRVDDQHLVLGSYAYAIRNAAPSAWAQAFLRKMDYDNATGSFVVVNGVMLGALSFADRLRDDAPRAVRKLRQAGIQRIVILTGDRLEPAQSVGAAVGADEVHAQLHPSDKLSLIEKAPAETPSIMVGDGINDAPALAAASVGIAMGARGATVASDTADVVLLTDRLDRIAEALDIAHRTHSIAKQSIVVGMGLSLLAMSAAAIGQLPPLTGAILQEAIDVAVIANALRAIGAGRGAVASPSLSAQALTHIEREHAFLAPLLARTHDLTDRLLLLPRSTALSELSALIIQLQQQLLPHEQSDEAQLYPKLAEKLGGDDPLAALSQSHREIFRLLQLLERITVDATSGSASSAPSLREIHGVLHRLDIVLDLHFAQENELFRNFDTV